MAWGGEGGWGIRGVNVLCLQAMELVFQSRAMLTVDYCESFLAPTLDQWRDLLGLLLNTCSSAAPDSHTPNTLTQQDHTPNTPAPSPEPTLHTHLALYRGEWHTTACTSTGFHGRWGHTQGGAGVGCSSERLQ